MELLNLRATNTKHPPAPHNQIFPMRDLVYWGGNIFDMRGGGVSTIITEGTQYA